MANILFALLAALHTNLQSSFAIGEALIEALKVFADHKSIPNLHAVLQHLVKVELDDVGERNEFTLFRAMSFSHFRLVESQVAMDHPSRITKGCVRLKFFCRLVVLYDLAILGIRYG